MAKRGPKPKPTALKLLTGAHTDRIPPPGPTAPPGRPDCPGHLDAVARAEWDRMAPLLGEMGVLTRIDGTALALYCAAYSRWVRAEEGIRTHGLTAPTARGGTQPSPWVRIARDAARAMLGLLAEFGGTPSSRSRLAVGRPEPKDELGEFLARRGDRDADP